MLIINSTLFLLVVLSFNWYFERKKKDREGEYQKLYLTHRKKQKFVRFYDNEFIPILLESEK